MENECHLLDLAVVEEDSVDEGGVSWGHFVEDSKTLIQVRADLERWGENVSCKRCHIQVFLDCGKI